MALSEDQILTIISQELADAIGGSESDSTESDRQAALATYLGQPNGKEVEGRSHLVSTDVADAIEWIMPEVVKSFTQNNEVVTFDPVYEGDEEQAELESQYVYDILMKDNDGFTIIHQFVKDALMQKNGFIKVFYEKLENVRQEVFTGITENELAVAISDPNAEIKSITEYTDGDIPLYDCVVEIVDNHGKVSIVSVPPEEFRCNRMHNSINLDTARFTAHVMLKTASEVVEMGVDKEDVDKMGSATVTDDDRQYRFYMQGETTTYDDGSSLDPSLRIVEISECYMHMDIDEDGIAEFVKITVAGGDNSAATQLIDVETLNTNPFVSATAILMSHKLLGLSIYDRLRQIQDQKTSLWRNIMDNMYLQNNQRTIVVENQVNLDDLMVSRPGGIIRVKRPDAVMPFPTPPLNGDSYKMMEYLDQVRAGRSGVSPEGVVQDQKIGDRVGSEGVERMMNQKEELVGLMIRVFAETGIKPLCYKIRDAVIAHQDVARDYKHRGRWISVDPKRWNNRSHTTVRVGTGSGNRKMQASTLMTLMTVQEKMLMNPQQSLIKEEQVFTLLDDYVKLTGFPSARRYFMDPKSPEGQENKKAVDKQGQEAKEKADKLEATAIDAQVKIAKAEEKRVEVEAMNAQLKNQVDAGKNQLTAYKDKAASEAASYKLQIERLGGKVQSDHDDKDRDFKYYDSDQKAEIAREQMSMTAKMASDNNENLKKATNNE